MRDPRILVAGSANIDLVTHTFRIPQPGETVVGHRFDVICGGKGANQAVAAARLGAEVHFAGCVGSDAFGSQQRQAFEHEGIGLDYLKVHPSRPTGTATIVVADSGQNAIIITPGANGELRPEDIRCTAPLFERGLDAVLVQMEIPDDTVFETLRLARESGVVSILDIGVARSVPEVFLRAAAVVSPNETEAEAMTGLKVSTIDDAERAALALQAMGAREVVLKLGEKGALYAGERRVHVPAFPIKAVDTTAAGDAFTAALALMWRRVPVDEALRFANAAGALAASKCGAQPSMPTRAACEAFLRQMTAM